GLRLEVAAGRVRAQPVRDGPRHPRSAGHPRGVEAVIRIPGSGIVQGMLFTFRKIFEKKATVQYPEVVQDISPKHRGRLLLLYDEYGALKCETCFLDAQACLIECIDMVGVDTKNRFHIHWGPAEQYAERGEESALRRSVR